MFEDKGIMDADTEERLRATMAEAERFLAVARVAFKRHKAEKEIRMFNTREMGQVRRSSLDLSQALVRFRRTR